MNIDQRFLNLEMNEIEERDFNIQLSWFNLYFINHKSLIDVRLFSSTFYFFLLFSGITMEVDAETRCGFGTYSERFGEVFEGVEDMIRRKGEF